MINMSPLSNCRHILGKHEEIVMERCRRRLMRPLILNNQKSEQINQERERKRGGGAVRSPRWWGRSPMGQGVQVGEKVWTDLTADGVEGRGGEKRENQFPALTRKKEREKERRRTTKKKRKKPSISLCSFFPSQGLQAWSEGLPLFSSGTHFAQRLERRGHENGTFWEALKSTSWYPRQLYKLLRHFAIPLSRR